MTERKHKTTGDDFRFVLDREGTRTSLHFQGQGRTAGKTGGRLCSSLPDFRRFTGVRRELLREFIAHKKDSEYSYDFDGNASDTLVLFNPDERLIRASLEAGLLLNRQGEILLRSEGSFRCALLVEDFSDDSVDVSIVLKDEDDSTIASGRSPTLVKASAPSSTDSGRSAVFPPFFTVSQSLAISGNKVFQINDLGLNWSDTDRVHARLRRDDLPAFLSLLFSTLSNLELVYEGWQVRRAKPTSALPALLFMEVDEYEYLHVRPVSFIGGFSPLFLENESIISVVRMDESQRALDISEIVFPEDPEDDFRELLNRGGNKEAVKKSVHEENGRFIIAPDFAGVFLEKNIVELVRRFTLLETQVLNRYGLKFSKPRVRLSMGKGIDYL